jgi:DNA-binding NarL/FixJ family response regulator
MKGLIRQIIEDLRVVEQEIDDNGIVLARRSWNDIGRRELEVLYLVANGLTSKEIAEKLRKSVRTVEAQRFRLCQRVGAKTIAQAVAMACKAGILR